MTRALILLLFALTAGFSGYAQTNCIAKLRHCLRVGYVHCDGCTHAMLDSLAKQNYLTALADSAIVVSELYLGAGEYLKAVDFLKRARRAAAILNDADRLEQVFSLMGKSYLYKSELDSARHYYQKALKASGKLSETRRAFVQLRLAQVENEMGNTAFALAQFLKALAVFKSAHSVEGLAAAHYALGNFYGWHGDDSLSSHHFYRSLKYYRQTDEEMYYGYALTNYSNVSLNLGHNDTAIKYLPRALAIFENRNDRAMMNALAQLGKAYFYEDQPEAGLEQLRRSNQLAYRSQVADQMAFNHQLMAVIFRSLNRLDSAARHVNLSLEYQHQYGMSLGYLHTLGGAMEFYAESGDYERAYELSQQFIEVRDSLFSLEKQQQITELEERYAADLREEQIKAGEAAIALLREQNTAKSLRNYVLFLMLLLVGGFTFAVIARQRTMLRLNSRLAEEKEKAHEAELQARAEEEKRLSEALDHKRRELAGQALVMAEKNEMLRSFRDQLHEVSERMEESAVLNQLVHQIERAENKVEDWDKFMLIFEEVHPEFLQGVKERFKGLTHNDLRLVALMKMNFSNKEIANILHISDAGLKKARYRLRKKMDLASDENMHEFVNSL